MNIAKKLVDALKEKQKPSAYDAKAVVKRVEGNIAWVQIAGGIDETPVQMAIHVKAGDNVNVRLSGGSAWITGNNTAPPTDDKAANEVGLRLSRTEKSVQKKLDENQTEIEEVDLKAEKALASADGKNTVYYTDTEPEGDLKANDTWFNAAEDNAIYRYNGTAWVKEELGEDAIADLSITNAKIKDATIQSAKIAYLDAAKITSGTIDTRRLNVAEIIQTGGIAITGDIPTNVSELDNDSGYATRTQAQGYADAAEDNAAADATTKANAAAKTATTYITPGQSGSGIDIHSDADLSNYINLSSSGTKVYVAGSKRAEYIANGVNLTKGDKLLASFVGTDTGMKMTALGRNAGFFHDYYTVNNTKTYTIGIRSFGSDTIELINSTDSTRRVSGNLVLGSSKATLEAYSYGSFPARAGITAEASGCTLLGVVKNLAYDTYTPDSNFSIASGTAGGHCGKFELPSAGIWIVTVTLRFGTNATGRRAVWLSEEKAGDALNVRSRINASALSGAQTFLQLTYVVRTNEAKTLYVVGMQNSGSTLEVTTRVAWVGVKDYQSF